MSSLAAAAGRCAGIACRAVEAFPGFSNGLGFRVGLGFRGYFTALRIEASVFFRQRGTVVAGSGTLRARECKEAGSFRKD